MVHTPFRLLALVIVVGMGCQGSSQPVDSELSPPADEDEVQTAAERSDVDRLVTRWWRDESIAPELELTDDQIEMIEELMTASAAVASQQRQQERRLGLSYLRVLAQDPYDPDQADRLSERLIEVLGEQHRRRVENVQELRDILTVDQWVKLWELAPHALQVGRFRAARGPGILVTAD